MAKKKPTPVPATKKKDQHQSGCMVRFPVWLHELAKEAARRRHLTLTEANREAWEVYLKGLGIEIPAADPPTSPPVPERPRKRKEG